jgi:hypothetical protein
MGSLRKKIRERLYHRGRRERAPFATYAQGKQRSRRNPADAPIEIAASGEAFAEKY